jgi:hypothetical protein
MTCLSCEERRAAIATYMRKMLHLPEPIRAKAIEQAKKDQRLYQALAASWLAEHPFKDHP